MKMIRKFLIVSLTLLFSAQLTAAPGLQSLIPPIPKQPNIAAKSYYMIDANSNKVIAEQDADKKVEPASLTKIMTVYIINQAIRAKTLSLDQEIPISKKAWKMQGSRMFVEVGSNVPLRELIKGIIIQSGNDASVAVAEYVAGSEEAFADLMNQEAAKLGMKNTHFMNSTGLPHADHYTTARDMSILAQAVIQTFPESYKIYSQKWFTYNNIKQPNRNRLLWHDPDVDGMKTGHTDSAGYCLVSSAKKNDMRLISVVIGADSDEARTKQAAKLLAYGFRFFETHKIYAADEAITEEKTWMGATDSVKLGLKRDLLLTLGNGQYNHIDAELHMPRVYKAPIKKGDKLGTLVIKLKDDTLITEDLIALNPVEEGGFFGRIADYLNLTLHNSLDKNQGQSEERVEKARI